MKHFFRIPHYLLLSGLVWLSTFSLSFAQTVTNQRTSATYSTIQAAVNAALANDRLVLSGPFNELVTIPISLTLDGQNNATVTYTGNVPSGTTGTLFKITSPNVTISNLAFTVDMSKLHSAIHTSGNCANLTVTGNTITPIGTASGSYTRRNAIAINPSIGGVTGYSNVGAGFAGVLVQNNTVNGNGGIPVFRAAIHMDLCGGTILSNTLLSINHDIISVFANQGDLSVQNNICNGGGIQIAEFNSGAGLITVSGNTLDGSIVQPASGPLGTSALLRLRNNSVTSSKIVAVTNNSFQNHRWAVSVENFNNVTFSGNIFTPKSGSTDFRHISFNTKLITSNSASFPNASMIPIGATLINNTFNGSGTLGGTAIAFFNHRTQGSNIGTYTIGTAGNENSFNNNIAIFLRLDNSIGQSSTFSSPFADYSADPTSPIPSTTMGYWTPNLDATNNKFDVGSGLKLASALSASERTTLDARLFDKKDDNNVGLITYFQPVRNVRLNTYYSTIQAAIDVASDNDVIELAEYTFNERATITRPLTLSGVSKTGTIIDGSSISEAGNGITLTNNVSGVTIKNLTIQKQKGAPNSPVGNGIYGERNQVNNNLIITDVVSVSNAGHGIYQELSGPLTNVSVTNSTLSYNGVGGAGRGFIIFNQAKQNITVSNNLVQNNGLTGIDINDGTVSGVTITNNTVSGNGDAGISVLGAKPDGGANLISGNTITNNGRYGMEVKSSIGNGATSGPGSLVIENNIISGATVVPASRDVAGISVTRRAAGSSINNQETPKGAVVRNNTVSGFVNGGTGDGFGIVVEGINYVVTGNTVSGNDVGIQEQQTIAGQRARSNPASPSDGDLPTYDVNDYFDRGNSVAACGTVSDNNTSNNTIPQRRVGPASFTVTALAGATTACVGQPIDLSAQVSNGASPFSFSWTASAGSSVAPTNASATSGTISVTGPATFSVTATDNFGCTAVSSVTVTGKNSPTLTGPVASSSACAGSTVTVSVTATDATSYQWYKDNTLLTDGGNVTGATTGTLTITNVQMSDAGNYRAAVTGTCTSLTSTGFSLTVGALPSVNLTNSGPLSFTNTPVALTATGGTSYSFSTGANQQGNGPNATVTTPGVYSVTATTNGCSGTASTTVLGGNNPTVCRGGTAVINVLVDGNPVKYEWYKNSLTSPKLMETPQLFRGTATSSLTLINAQTNTQGNFFLKVTDRSGQVKIYGPYRLTVDASCRARELAVEPVAEAGLGLTLLGNPLVDGRLKAVVKGAAGQRLELDLRDSQGRRVRSQQWQQAEGEQLVEWDLSQQPAGLYLLQAQTSQHSLQHKLIKP
ncbi:immunoglobulin domain-containing protein [Spirosoma knui]